MNDPNRTGASGFRRTQRVPLSDGRTVVVSPAKAPGAHVLAIESRKGTAVQTVPLTADESQQVARALVLEADA